MPSNSIDQRSALLREERHFIKVHVFGVTALGYRPFGTCYNLQKISVSLDEAFSVREMTLAHF